MKIELESTTKIVHLNGVPARVWEGKTAAGVPMHAFIVRVGVHQDADASEFERDLKEHAAPSPDVAAIPLRMVL